jgi:hypothetical protein
MAADKIEEAIQEIALRHGIAVGRDDPILVLQTLNERLLRDSEAAQREILEGFKSELEAIAHRWSEDARNRAERTLNAALAASREAMAQGMQEGAKAAVGTVQREFSAHMAMLTATTREARRVAMMNMIAAGLAVIAAALVLSASM